MAQFARHSDREVVYLVAPSGIPNYGDEFILRAWLRHLRRVRPEADLVIDCHTPGQAAVLLGRWHPRVTFVDTFWRICFATAELPPAEAIAAARDVVHHPGLMPKIVSGIERLARADVVHLVGGDTSTRSGHIIWRCWPRPMPLLTDRVGEQWPPGRV